MQIFSLICNELLYCVCIEGTSNLSVHFWRQHAFNTFTTLKCIWLTCILFVEEVYSVIGGEPFILKKLDKQVSSSSCTPLC